MSMTSASQAYFRQNADQWDELRKGYFGEEIRSAAVQKAYLRPEMTVADIGTGTGFMAAALAPRVAQVHAVDASAEMLAVARRNLAMFTNITYHQAAGDQLPFSDASLDAVFANMYLHHVVNPLLALREMARVLKPGGRVVITDLNAHPYAWLKQEMADEWQGFERSQVLDWFREAGFVNRFVESTGSDCCAESDGKDARIRVFLAVASRPVQGVTTAVRRGYSQVALSKGSCCGPTSESGCCQPSTSAPLARDYQPGELSLAPAESAELFLGCGNPTAMAALQPGERVLDIGSGAGFDAFVAAGKVGEHGQVIGVDMTPAMLSRARRTALQHGLANVEFRQGQAEDLPVENGAVDVVISNCVINLTHDKGKVFEEAYRVLSAGGRLEVSDIVAEGSFPSELVNRPENWSSCEYGALPEGEYLDLIRAAGFGQVQVRSRRRASVLNGVTLSSVIVSARKLSQPECNCCG